MRVEQYDLPAYWASYLINDDASGFDDDDIAVIDLWMGDFSPKPDYVDCVDVSDNVGFMHRHDASKWGVLAADCATFTFHIG